MCTGRWETWEALFPPIPLQRNREQLAVWLAQLPNPIAFDIFADNRGVRLRVVAPPGRIEGALNSWAAMMHHQTRWVKVDTTPFEAPAYVLKTQSVVPNLVVSEASGDPILAIGGQLASGLGPGQQAGLRFWLLGKNRDFQERVRALAAYSYGTESGVANQTPNVWGWQLSVWRAIMILGGLIVAVALATLSFHLARPAYGVVAFLAGLMVVGAGVMGMVRWARWRSTPKELLQSLISDTLFDTTFVAYGNASPDLSILSGTGSWKWIEWDEWPEVQRHSMPLPSMGLASLIAPPEFGEGSGVFASDAIQEIPAPPPSQRLVDNPAGLEIGRSVFGGQGVRIDPDGHSMSTGGSRSGKTSFAYNVLEQLIRQGDDAPGILLIDPHLSLSDSFLQAVHELPPDMREKAIARLRVISPDQPEVVPLNLLALPDFTWAANAIVQVGRRLWEDYWGPRMQSVLIGLFRLVHSVNMNDTSGRKMGLIHTIFAAFNTTWRHDAFPNLKPYERMTSISLDALLGQMGTSGRFEQAWVTEVVSPIISKVMNVELSAWLFYAMHQNSFADVEGWVNDKAWIVLRLPSGQMGRDGARLTAGVFYNVWDAIYRRATTRNRIPYYIFVDEVQEIGPGMRLETMLSEGAKFGARLFVLAQSLSLMRKIEGLDAVVESLLANTSTQAFFTPSPEDMETVRDTLSLESRYGKTTLDLPTLNCWLRARVGGQWQPPTTVTIPPLKAADPDAIQALIREVIAAHPADYVDPGPLESDPVEMLRSMLPPAARPLLDLAFDPTQYNNTPEINRLDGGQVSDQESDEGLNEMRNTGF